ncbi:hypothetical protein PV325_007293 [Microctonus aethiopoides]|uniref:Shugoshin C-terminal domain-containing protein n=1 Tax=Microctonus aethiopoides TaxID=144406 RepID=A0AA39C724_9HYME|nr:hypothetical protein PV325_007293 [Microctonus aethiopoides]KAK0158937.1 hypothetical protein PV328_009872 [Microctonus aethiopoides]
MPSVPNRRRVKRPTVLAKKSQHRIKSYNKNSRNLWYEKFKATKANNNALARALSKEKQESQYLFTQNVELTSQLQDMGVLVNSRNETLSGILKRSTEALKLLVQVTNCVTTTIVACQDVVGKSQSLNLRSSLSLNSTNSARRESGRRSIGKSPARGVVQPMVSGHTITKPVINLSRINMPRIRTEPNLSIIDESIDDSSPERSSINRTPHRIPVDQLNHITNRSVRELLPERIRLTSLRLSEENEQLSDNQNRRLSNRLSHANRNSRRVSRKSDQQQSSPNELSLSNDDLQSTIKSPRVTLQDVSRLLQNSHSINIRTLMASDEILIRQENENKRDTTSINDNDNIINDETEDDKINGLDSSASSESIISSPTYNFDPRTKKSKKNRNNKVEDPLEGPSWLYNSTEQIINSPKPNESSNNLESTKSSNEKNVDDENVSKLRWSERQSSKFNLTNATNHTSPTSIIGWAKTYPDYTLRNIENDGDDDDDDAGDVKNSENNENITGNDDDDDDDSEKCENLTNVMASFNLRKRRNDAFINDRLRQSKENVIRHRGASEIDDDDFTMMFDNDNELKQQNDNMDFDINELNLPVLERPLINAVEIEPEPEITATFKIITQAHHRIPSMARDNIDTSLMESNTTVLIPNIRDSSIPSDFDVDHNESNNDDNDSTDTSSIFNGINTRKRRRIIENRIESSSDSEPSTSPEKISTVRRKNIRKKDPSAAKVVLEKLKDNNCKKLNNSKISTNDSSINSVQSDAHSDSEDSNVSSIMSSRRPRRQKAPINLKEPKLGTKLRRP